MACQPKQTSPHFSITWNKVTDRLSDVVDGNEILQSLTPIPDLFEGLAEYIFNKLRKPKRVDIITDTYLQQFIMSYERARRGMTPKILLSCAKAKTPRNWKTLWAMTKNKTQLIKLLLEQ